MAKDGWDWGGIGPDLTKLPPHLRENLTKPIPLRRSEVYGRVLIFRRTPGLNHPNGRVLASSYYKDSAKPAGTPDGLQIDLSDFSGRLPLVTLILAKPDVLSLVTGIAHSFLALGGTEDEFIAAMKEARKPTSSATPLLLEVSNDDNE